MWVLVFGFLGCFLFFSFFFGGGGVFFVGNVKLIFRICIFLSIYFYVNYLSFYLTFSFIFFFNY